MSISIYFSDPFRFPRRKRGGPPKPICDECNSTGKGICLVHGEYELKAPKLPKWKKVTLPKLPTIVPYILLKCRECKAMIEPWREIRINKQIFCGPCGRTLQSKKLMDQTRFLEKSRDTWDAMQERQYHSLLFQLGFKYRKIQEVRTFLESRILDCMLARENARKSKKRWNSLNHFFM